MMTALINELIDLYEPITRACCRSHRLSEDQIDDIMHDTFLAAYQNLSKYSEQAKISSWLWTIARRQIINQLRKQSARKLHVNADPSNSLLITTQNPAMLAQSWELRQKLHARIEALPPTWMMVVKLYYWHQKDTYEIAMRMQIEPGTIRVILHRSRQRLRRELERMYAA
jgi:RNA polymerase sigma-70 factor (ECF subfamily)